MDSTKKTQVNITTIKKIVEHRDPNSCTKV